MPGHFVQRKHDRELLFERALHLEDGKNARRLWCRDDGRMSGHTSLRHGGHLADEARDDRLVESPGARPDPNDEREAERDRDGIGEDGRQPLFADLIEQILEVTEEGRERALFPAEAALLFEPTSRDEEAAT